MLTADARAEDSLDFIGHDDDTSSRSGGGIMHLTHLGITNIANWRHITSFRNGLVLIAGSEGSGKTMTLDATVCELQGSEKYVYTLPDPIDWHPPLSNYVRAPSPRPLDFAAGIKAFMRADPDVIVLGEIQEPVAAKKAMQAAETGHLVIASINAESVRMALHRLLNFGVELEDLEILLRGVLFQFLARAICRNCSGTGCELCFGKGYDNPTVVSKFASVRMPVDVRMMISPDDDECIGIRSDRNCRPRTRTW